METVKNNQLETTTCWKAAAASSRRSEKEESEGRKPHIEINRKLLFHVDVDSLFVGIKCVTRMNFYGIKIKFPIHWANEPTKKCKYTPARRRAAQKENSFWGKQVRGGGGGTRWGRHSRKTILISKQTKKTDSRRRRCCQVRCCVNRSHDSGRKKGNTTSNRMKENFNKAWNENSTSFPSWRREVSVECERVAPALMCKRFPTTWNRKTNSLMMMMLIDFPHFCSSHTAPMTMTWEDDDEKAEKVAEARESENAFSSLTSDYKVVVCCARKLFSFTSPDTTSGKGDDKWKTWTNYHLGENNVIDSQQPLIQFVVVESATNVIPISEQQHKKRWQNWIKNKSLRKDIDYINSIFAKSTLTQSRWLPSLSVRWLLSDKQWNNKKKFQDK